MSEYTGYLLASIGEEATEQELATIYPAEEPYLADYLKEREVSMDWPMHLPDDPKSTYEALLKDLGEVSYKRLMYGEWLPDVCEECHTTKSVTKFVDVSGKEKKPIYLCDTCFYAGLGPTHLREWTAEDDTRR